ncbi:MAG TPA: hypothetical protein PLY70_01605 [Saprospiraceae bacterium]|mgnify:CR=1 FL=1|nr:hypothetical protein [Saprospiraceae bacterium]
MKIEKTLLDFQNFNIVFENVEAVDLQDSLSRIFSLQLTNFFPTICSCLLTGEYIRDDKFIANLLELRESFKRINDDFLLYLDDERKDDIAYLFTSANSVINRVLNLVADITRKNEKKSHKKLFISEDSKELFSHDQTDIKFKYAQEINSIIVSVEYFDHFLTVDDHKLERLALLFEKIENTNFENEIKILCRAKITILIKKILYRLKGDQTYGYRYVHNYKDKQLIDFLEPLVYFKQIDQLILNHYHDELDTKNDSGFKAKIDDILTKGINDFSEYQLIIKFYKDKAKSRPKIKEYLDKFKNKSNNYNEDKFEKYAFDVANLYLNNNLLSIDKVENNIENLDATFREIEVLKEETGINNYFPYLYYCQFLIDKLIKLLENNDDKDSDQFTNLLSKLELNKKKAYEALEWCYDRDFMSFKAPFSECVFIDEENENLKLFVASSYILPNNYRQVRIELEEISDSFKSFKTVSELLRSHNLLDKKLTNKIEEATNSFDDIKTIAKESQKNNIEILSIFAAIVLFVATNTQVYQFVESTHLALVFMLTMAFSLSLFVMLIWLITREYSKNVGIIPTIHKWIIGILAVSTIITFLYLLCSPFPDQAKIKEFNITKNKIDNLEKQLKSNESILLKLNVKIDSIENIIIKGYKIKN